MYSAPSETKLTEGSPAPTPTPSHTRIYTDTESEDARSRAVHSLASHTNDSSHSLLSHNVSNFIRL